MYIYDVEVFPNFFCATFLQQETREIYQFVIHETRDERLKLRKFLSGLDGLIGFNNISYDDPVLRYILFNLKSNKLNSKLFELSKRLINDFNRKDQDLLDLRYRNRSWKQLDLLKVMAFDKLGVGLKQTAINLKWHKIQDLPLPYNHIVKNSEIDIILEYNLNDVLITEQLFLRLEKDKILPLRRDISTLYNVDVTNASDSKMANLLLEKFYIEQTGIELSELRDLRTRYEYVRLSECIGDDICFTTPKLQELLEDLKSVTLTAADKFSYKRKLLLNGVSYQLGIGGLHSEDTAKKYIFTPEYIIRDADVASYYPNIIINKNLYPKHLQPEFIDVLKMITKERLEAKDQGNKVKADGLKITINSIFGKLGSNTFWLEDIKAMLTVTVSGQLYLLMLIEALYNAGIQNISANTDGIVCKVSPDKEQLYNKICKEWSEKTNYELEFTDYDLYVRSDVNNYITRIGSGKKKGEIKVKGRFLREIDLKKGYSHPIVPIALYEYFINGIKPETTIETNTDIMNFCMSQKTGHEFKTEHYVAGKGLQTLQKNNRFYVSNSGGNLQKRNVNTGKVTGLVVDNFVHILNDFDYNTSFDSYDVNLKFYIDKTYEIIDAIEPAQIDMFCDLVDVGNKTKIPILKIPILRITQSEKSIYGQHSHPAGYNLVHIPKHSTIHYSTGSKTLCGKKWDRKVKDTDSLDTLFPICNLCQSKL